jgi:hypothetical protein
MKRKTLEEASFFGGRFFALIVFMFTVTEGWICLSINHRDKNSGLSHQLS